MPAITAEIPFEGVIRTFDVKLAPEPVKPKAEADKPEVKLPQPKAAITEKPMVERPVFRDPPQSQFASLGENIDLMGSGDAIEFPIDPVVIPPILPDPTIVAPRLNGRFAADFQPNYPSGLLRMGEEGMVSVRVLVGTNGRVKQIELISTPHEGFWLATKRHTTKNWRFKPATKDGKPYESWMTLKVKFEINS